MGFRSGRVYDPRSEHDGARVLVDRLWPRGLSKESADLDLWAKDVAPSTDLRTWFHAHPDEVDEFAARYRAELDAVPDALGQLRELGSTVTLLSASREAGHVAVLLEVLSSEG
jgi:uncharacterized protein YeaO (DUF488 family)